MEKKYEINPGDTVMVQLMRKHEYQMIGAKLIQSPIGKRDPWIFESEDGTNKIVAHIYKDMILSKVIS